MARSNPTAGREAAAGTGRRRPTGTAPSRDQVTTRPRAAGQPVARGPRASKRSQAVIRQISIDRRDAIRELADR